MSEIKLSIQQIEKMRHAIGLKDGDLRHGQYRAYRNNFVITGEDKDWEELVSAGCATKRVFDRQAIYCVSSEGAKHLSRLYNLTIDLGS